MPGPGGSDDDDDYDDDDDVMMYLCPGLVSPGREQSSAHLKHLREIVRHTEHSLVETVPASSQMSKLVNFQITTSYLDRRK